MGDIGEIELGGVQAVDEDGVGGIPRNDIDG
jgi:hypothetical protein